MTSFGTSVNLAFEFPPPRKFLPFIKLRPRVEDSIMKDTLIENTTFRWYWLLWNFRWFWELDYFHNLTIRDPSDDTSFINVDVSA